MPTVVRQEWHEDDNGVVREHSYSLHVDLDHLRDYVTAHWNAELEASVEAPDVYTFPEGDPTIVELSQVEYDALVNAGGNLRKS